MKVSLSKIYIVLYITVLPLQWRNMANEVAMLLYHCTYLSPLPLFLLLSSLTLLCHMSTAYQIRKLKLYIQLFSSLAHLIINIYFSKPCYWQRMIRLCFGLTFRTLTASPVPGLSGARGPARKRRRAGGRRPHNVNQPRKRETSLEVQNWILNYEL